MTLDHPPCSRSARTWLSSRPRLPAEAIPRRSPGSAAEPSSCTYSSALKLYVNSLPLPVILLESIAATAVSDALVRVVCPKTSPEKSLISTTVVTALHTAHSVTIDECKEAALATSPSTKPEPISHSKRPRRGTTTRALPPLTSLPNTSATTRPSAPNDAFTIAHLHFLHTSDPPTDPLESSLGFPRTSSYLLAK